MGRPSSQVIVEFVAAPPDRLGMQASDLRDSLETAVPQSRGFTRRHPATLLLVQATQ